ncbi:hypothetical protein D3C84_1206000 [compost metagenome]
MPMPSPKIARNPSITGSSELPTSAAPPPSPVLKTRVSTEKMSRVMMPQIRALGISRTMSVDSSAARGSCSIAR